jgi:hypothetical protein
MIFPKAPIIIAMNLNIIDGRRISLGTVEKCVAIELFAMVVFLRNVKTTTPIYSTVICHCRDVF